MGFKRQTSIRAFDRRGLNAAMIGIGLRFVGDADRTAPIEDTLVAASAEGMDREDLRVLSVLTTWIDVHAARIHVDRLYRGLAGQSSRVKAYWSAIANWKRADPRWRRVEQLHHGPRVDLVEDADFLLRRNGEDPRFAGGALRAPAGTLRDRRSDVSSPEQLARRHRGYRLRVLMGRRVRS